MRSRAESSAGAGTATGGTWPSLTRASIPSTSLRRPSTDGAPSTRRPRSGGRRARRAGRRPARSPGPPAPPPGPAAAPSSARPGRAPRGRRGSSSRRSRRRRRRSAGGRRSSASTPAARGSGRTASPAKSIPGLGGSRVERRRQHLLVDRPDRLQQAGGAGARLQVADVALRRSEGDRALRRPLEDDARGSPPRPRRRPSCSSRGPRRGRPWSGRAPRPARRARSPAAGRSGWAR